MACGDDNMPRDAKMIKALLTSMGVNNYEPSVIRQFLELYYRNAVDLLMDAKTYSNHADKACIDYADIELAIKSKSYFSFTHPPLPEVTEAALKLNKVALPRLPALWPSLPPNQDTLIASCYQPKVQKNRYGNAVNEQEEECVTEVIQNAKEQVATEDIQIAKGQVCFPKPAQKRRTNLLLQTREPVSFPHGRSLKRQR